MAPRRVVVTGLGIVSCIGNSQQDVVDSLRAGRSGITFSPEYAERGFRSHVFGKPDIDLDTVIDRKLKRFMGDAAAYNHVAMEQAIADSGLEPADVSNERTGIIMGSGGPSPKKSGRRRRYRARSFRQARRPVYGAALHVFDHFGPTFRRISRSRASTTLFLRPARPSAHCIGNAAEQIMWGKQDVMFAGGGEELDWDLKRAVRRHGRVVQPL